MSKSIAIIPARGGSKRVPRKNIRSFLGVPAIERVVRVLQASEVVDRIVVSTDDPSIATLASQAGAEVPGLRPSELSDDHTSTVDVVRHALTSWCTVHDSTSRAWVIYPTALLLSERDIRAADDRFRLESPDFLVSILRFPHPVERRIRMLQDGTLQMATPAAAQVRTQDLQPAYHDAGQFYIGTVLAWMTSTPLNGARSIGYELPRTSVVDIDHPDDWALAEALARARDS